MATTACFPDTTDLQSGLQQGGISNSATGGQPGGTASAGATSDSRGGSASDPTGGSSSVDPTNSGGTSPQATGGAGLGSGGVPAAGGSASGAGGTSQGGSAQGNAGQGSSVKTSDPGTCKTVIGESANDFSSTQGTHNWYYGYYAASTGLVSSQFKQFTVFLSACTSLSEPAWQESVGWAAISQHKAHPNGVLTSTLADEQWSVRRWVSTIDGIVMVSGSIAKDPSTTYGGSGPNGVYGHIFVGNEEVWGLYVPPTQTTPTKYQFWVTVQTGTTIDFALDAYQGNDWSDATDWDCALTACGT